MDKNFIRIILCELLVIFFDFEIELLISTDFELRESESVFESVSVEQEVIFNIILTKADIEETVFNVEEVDGRQQEVLVSVLFIARNQLVLQFVVHTNVHHIFGKLHFLSLQ